MDRANHQAQYLFLKKKINRKIKEWDLYYCPERLGPGIDPIQNLDHSHSKIITVNYVLFKKVIIPC